MLFLWLCRNRAHFTLSGFSVFPDATRYNSNFWNRVLKFSSIFTVQVICIDGCYMSILVLYFCHHVIYCDELCIKNKSDFLCAFKSIYRAVSPEERE